MKKTKTVTERVEVLISGKELKEALGQYFKEVEFPDSFHLDKYIGKNDYLIWWIEK